MDYLEKLKDPRWQKKRLEIFERDGWACKMCGAKHNTLNVHHLFYFPGRDPWDIPNGFLVTLCEECHSSQKEPHADAAIDYIGTLLDTIWSLGFDTDDVLSIASAINDGGKRPDGPIWKFNVIFCLIPAKKK